MVRPAFHFSPPVGWLNDPNGLVFHGGFWHLFYQHEPAQLQHGPMHWGHAVSGDLFTWEHWPIALYPDELGTIWSGSAVVDVRADGTERLVACFTQAQTPRGQIQSLAFSDDEGRTWRPFENNPVLTGEGPDFRDPKVFRFDERWILVVAAGNEAHFYGSPDLIGWTQLSRFPAPHADWIWECPDLIQFEDAWILMVSFIVPGAGVAGGSCTRYWVGDFDGTTFLPRSAPQPLSFGPDDYAAVSWSGAPDGRRIILGWMAHWHYADKIPTEAENWRGAMTLPRELFFESGTLRQRPPRELLGLRGEAITLNPDNIAFRGECFELEAEWDVTALQEEAIGVRVRVGEKEATRVLYYPASGELTVDRTRSGQVAFHPEFAGVFRAPLRVENGILKLRLFVDRCSVEVFAQDGELYGAALVFPSKSSQNIELVGSAQHFKGGTIFPIVPPIPLESIPTAMA